MRSRATRIAFVVLSLVVLVFAEFSDESFEATTFFDVVANSTCDCSNHSLEFALDDDLSTWWQSGYGDDTVSLIFSIKSPLSLMLSGIRLTMRSFIPTLYHLRVYQVNSTLSEQVVYVNDSVFCENIEIPCGVFTVSSDTVKLLFSSTTSQAVAQFILTLSFLQMPEDDSHIIMLSEVETFAQIVRGFYASSLDAIRIEGERGIVQDTSVFVPHSSNVSLFDGFSGRGFASLNYTDSAIVSVQWVFPFLPSSVEYQFGFIYSSHDRRSRRVEVLIMQEGSSIDARVTFLAGCVRCTAYLLRPSQLFQPANFSLTESMLTIVVSLSSIDISLDAIVAIPRDFFDPETLSDPPRFLSTCDIYSDQFTDSFCLRSALQLSVEFFLTTHECSCQPENSLCQVYGGQCNCSQQMSLILPVGRQCDLCPFFSYLTSSGCTGCECPNESDDCDAQTGACESCPSLAFGASCENCVQNYFRHENDSCVACECDRMGSILCNETTGVCLCKEGVEGRTCDMCSMEHFNFSSSGCTSCNCGIGSINGSCEDNGQCYCQGGVSGLKCSVCSDGFYFLSARGCLPCNCSNRTTQCTLASNSIGSEPQEMCSCPFPYTGMSCEFCASGYFLSDISGRCEQCDCNGRADTCRDGNGECIMCRNNTTGTFCDTCIEGMYSPDAESLICQPCPCSTITAHNNSCTVDLFGQPSCYCLPGHMGSLCGSCSSGYFGLPPDSRCRDCSCNGNIDPTIPGSCHPENGTCLICINNATGSECEFCQPGYFGDATSQDCQLCNCNNVGSNNSVCDRSNGQCSCLDGVDGFTCNQCRSGYWNFVPGEGCEECQCGAASSSLICHSVTGQCPCKSGVEGMQCSRCMDGFFNFTVNGCSDCSCGIGSSNQSCSDNGICYCLSGVTGAKCDSCLPFHSALSSSGCQPCGGCERTLALLLFETRDDIASTVQLNVTSFRSLLIHDMANNVHINSSLNNLFIRKQLLSDIFDIVEANLIAQNATTLLLLLTTSIATEQQVLSSLANVDVLQPQAHAAQANLLEISTTMQEVFIDTGNVNASITSINNLLTTQANSSTEIRSNFPAKTGSIQAADIQYQGIIGNAKAAQSTLSSLLMPTMRQQTQASEIEDKYSGVNLDTTIAQLFETERIIGHLENQCVIVSNLSTQLFPEIQSFHTLLTAANNSLVRVEGSIAESEMLLLCARGDIQIFSQIIGNLLSNETEISSEASGSGLALTSGSGFIDEHRLVNEIESAASIYAHLPNLKVSIFQLIEQLRHYNASSSNIVRFVQEALTINNTLIPVLEQGNFATEVIMSYLGVMKTLNQVKMLSNETGVALEYVVNQSLSLLENNLLLQDSLLLNSSYHLLSSAQELSSDTSDLLESINVAEIQDISLASNSTSLNGMVIQLSYDIANLNAASLIASTYVNQTLSQIDSEIIAARDGAAELSDLLPALQGEALMVGASLNNSIAISDSTEVILNTITSSAMATRMLINNRTTTLSVANQSSLRNQLELLDANSSLSNLRFKLSEALTAAAKIDLALQLFGNSSYSYPVENVSISSFQSVSMLFNPDNVTSGSLLVSAQGAGGNQTVIQLSSGSVLMNMGPDVISVGGGTLRRNQWYQLYATKDDRETVLSVAILPHNGSAMTGSIQNSDLVSLFQDGSVAIGSNYEGCLDQLIVNQLQLSLLNPLDTDSEIVTCGPRPPSESVREFSNGVWLFGALSYVDLFVEQSLSSELQINLQFRTLDAHGLLLFYPSSDLAQYLAVYLLDGKVMLDYRLTSLDRLIPLQSASFYNTGLWYDLVVSVDGPNVTLVINETEILSGTSSTIENGARFSPSKTLLLGGLSTDYEIFKNSLATASSIAGCVRNLQIGNSILNLQNSTSQRVDFGGCPEAVAPGVRFMGRGNAEFSISRQQLHSISFGFRTTQLSALLLHIGGLSVRIFHTKIRVDMNDQFILMTEESNLNDNVRHTLFLLYSSAGIISNISLSVDGKTPVSTSLPGGPVTFGQLYLGGINTSTEYYRGCMDSVILNGQAVNFDGAESLNGISLYGCRPASQHSRLLPPPPPIPPPPSAPRNLSSLGLNGNPGSFVSLLVSQDQVIESFSISVEFITVHSEGLLLFMQGDRIGSDFFALELVSGRLLFSYNLGSGQAQFRSSGSYNDGLLHSVQVQRMRKLGELIVDGGLEHVTGSSPGNFTLLNVNSGYLFLGGVPLTYQSQIIETLQQVPAPILACFHSISVNGVFEDLSQPQASSGAEQCLAVYNNLVTLQQNAYMVLLNPFNVGVRLNISVDFRTSNCSGLLFYITSSIYSDHLLVELRDGLMVLEFDNGPFTETLVYNDGRQLCDGEWHSLFVSKIELAGSISVDGNALQSEVSSCDVCPNFIAANTDSPMYVGGLPDFVRSRYNILGGSFLGCLSNLYIHQEDREQQSLLFSQAQQYENVQLDRCNY